MKISQNFSAFSEYMNFNRDTSIHDLCLRKGIILVVSAQIFANRHHLIWECTKKAPEFLPSWITQIRQVCWTRGSKKKKKWITSHSRDIALNMSKIYWLCFSLNNKDMTANRNTRSLNPFDCLTQKPLWHKNNPKWSCLFSLHWNDTKFLFIIRRTQ